MKSGIWKRDSLLAVIAIDEVSIAGVRTEPLVRRHYDIKL